MSKMKNWLIVSLAVVILTLSFATVLQAGRLNDCYKACSQQFPNSYRMFKACMFGCTLPR